MIGDFLRLRLLNCVMTFDFWFLNIMIVNKKNCKSCIALYCFAVIHSYQCGNMWWTLKTLADWMSWLTWMLHYFLWACPLFMYPSIHVNMRAPILQSACHLLLLSSHEAVCHSPLTNESSQSWLSTIDCSHRSLIHQMGIHYGYKCLWY